MCADHIVNDGTPMGGKMRIVVRPRPRLRPLPYGKHQSAIVNDPNFRMGVRDRAAYVFITGTFPTHLRELQTSVIREITTYSKIPTSLDGKLGNFRIKQEVIDDLKPEEHPMVQMVRRYLDEGWSIALKRPRSTRRPFSKVFIWKKVPAKEGSKKRVTSMLTVQIDSSVKPGWD